MNEITKSDVKSIESGTFLSAKNMQMNGSGQDAALVQVLYGVVQMLGAIASVLIDVRGQHAE